MAILTKNALSASNQASFPNNTTGAITPLILRNFNQDVIDTLVDSLNTGSYAVTTGSNDFTQPNNFTSISASSFVSASQFVGDGSKLTNITASISLPILDEGIPQGNATSMNFTGSAISATIVGGTAVVQVNIDNVGLVTTASFNAYTSSTNTSITNLNASSASQQISINALNQSSASQQVSINALNVYTASQDSSSIVNSITELNAWSASAKIELVNLNTSVTNLNSFSSSANSSITQLNASSASQQVSINNLNTTTSSLLIETQNLELFSASALISISNLNQSSASQQVSINSLNAATASYVTETESGSFLITASVNLNTITFTKGNNTTFAVTVNTGSAITTDLTSLNAFTQSQYVSNSFFATTASFNSYTQSNDQRVSSLEANSASVNTSVTNINQFTQSAQVSINSLNSATSSYVTESETASFARTNVDNNFTANQTFTNITAVSASFTYIQTTYETASVIYSSGSNQFGDELSDTQTLSGSVKVQGSLTVNGTPVLTSSVDISGLTTTASFNAYTQSANQRIGSLEAATSSYVTSAITASSLVTASVNLNTITFTKGDASTFNIIVNTGSAVTTDITALNSFTSSQLTINSAIEASTSSLNTFSASTLTRLTNIENTTASLNSSVAALNTFTASQSTASLVTSITNLNSFTQSQEAKDLTLQSVTSSLNSATASLFTSASLGLTTASVLVNVITFKKGDGTTFDLTITASGSVTPGTISGSAQITALGFVSSSVTASSLVTASFDNGTRNLTFTKGDASTFSVNIPDVSGSSSGFATLGANTFTGSQTISSSLFISGNINMVNGSDLVTHHVKAAGSNGLELQTSAGTIIVSMGAGGGTQATFVGAVSANSISASTINGLGDPLAFSTSVDSRLDSLEGVSGSFATTGSNSFIGNQTITGSLILSSSNAVELTVIGNMVVTGSAFGNVVSMSITANTASMDLSRGNYFTLTLADTATTHISASNVQPGVSATLVITTGTNSSASLAPTMLQPSGSAYSATNGSAKKDVLSIVAVASNVPFVVSTKNMI